MSRPATRVRSTSAALLALALAAGAGAGEISKSEFFAQSADYLGPLQNAATEVQALVQAEKIKVVAVAEFTDMTGGRLHVGRIYAEELSTLLVAAPTPAGQKKGPAKHRVMDPSAIDEFVGQGGGGSLWSSTKKIREFGKASGVQLVVTGKIEISNREARLFLKAVETAEASIIWARTISVPGVAAGTETVAAPVAPAAPALEAQPLAAEATATEPAATEPAATAAASTTSADRTPSAAPAAAAGVLAAAGAASSAAAAATPTAAATGTKPADAKPSDTKPADAKPADAKPAPTAAAAPSATTAAATTAATTTAAATTAAATTAAAGAAPAAAAPAPAIPLAAVGLPPEVVSFENGWLRARIRSASKYEGSGWVTAVLDVTNLSDRPVFIDVAQDDPGRGVDEFGNPWRVERVSGLRLAPSANPGMTPLTAQATISVVVVLATTAQPSGKRVSFGPNLLWWGSNAANDNGRVAVAFANVRVD